MLLVPKATGEEQEDLSSQEKEAAVIAGKIREMVGHFPVTDKETGELRPARYRDVVILLRSGTGYEDALRTILEQGGNSRLYHQQDRLFHDHGNPYHFAGTAGMG